MSTNEPIRTNERDVCTCTLHPDPELGRLRYRHNPDCPYITGEANDQPTA